MNRARKILVVVRRALSAPRASQGLRTAVAYAAYGLDVTVILCGAQDAEAAAPVQRHLQTLRALGKRVVVVSPDDADGLCRELAAADADATAPIAIVW